MTAQEFQVWLKSPEYLLACKEGQKEQEQASDVYFEKLANLTCQDT